MGETKKQDANLIPISMVRDAQNELTVALEHDPKYMISADPTGALGLNETQKRFIDAYIECRSISYACQLTGITEEEGRDIYFDPICKRERDRINRALNYRRFSRRLLSIDEVGGYLTSLLMDEDFGLGERLTAKDKLTVTRQILDINKMKAEAYMNPRILENVEFVEKDTKDMSAEDLKKLIDQTKQTSAAVQNEKQKLIDKLNAKHEFDPSDIAHFWKCSVNELQQILDEKEKLENGNQDLSSEIEQETESLPDIHNRI